MNLKNIIVIGASAGGFKPITELIKKIPADLPVAIFVVVHLAKSSSPDILIQHLKKNTTYKCQVPDNEDPIAAGNLYLAPPDYHMLISDDRIRILKGAHENRWRPSVDVLFRSAAATFGPCVIGIVLSGMMDDGTSGMSAIKRSGGTCIVQEPEDAQFSDMPLNVINNVKVDYQVPISDMSYILDDIVSKPTRDHAIPEEIKVEAAITERMVSTISELSVIGTHSNYTCPDCGGNLWDINNEPKPRYRCHTGHVYAESILIEKQNEQIEESLWISIRMLEERRNLLLNIANREKGSERIYEDYQRKAEQLNTNIEHLKSLLVSLSKRDDPKDFKATG